MFKYQADMLISRKKNSKSRIIENNNKNFLYKSDIISEACILMSK